MGTLLRWGPGAGGAGRRVAGAREARRGRRSARGRTPQPGTGPGRGD
ncbi:MAG: hypothetical protein ACK559_31965 [bacterium]